jgi:chromosome segregation protein
LARLNEEAKTLGPADGAAAEKALKAAQQAERDAAARRAQAEAQLEAITAGAAAQRARAQALADTASAARGRLQRLEAQQQSLEAQIAALPAADALAGKIAEAKARAETAHAQSAALRAKLQETETALKRAEAADEATWAPYRGAEKALQQLEAEVRAIEKLAPPEAAKYPPVLASIDVEPGYERALAAALGDDIEVTTHAEAPAHWGGAEMPDANLPASSQSLTRFVKAPAALAARLSLIGVVDAKDGPALAKQLTPGARLVSKEGDLWRWDGFVRRADAPQPAAARLEHKNRLGAARAELKGAEERLAQTKAAWEAAKAERQALDGKTRDLRGQAPKLAAADADAVREAERLEAESARIAQRSEDLRSQLAALDAEMAEARGAASAASSAAGEAPA